MKSIRPFLLKWAASAAAAIWVCLFFSGAQAQALTLGEKLIETGEKYIGTPYQWGAGPSQTRTFDCSSFIQRIFLENGMTLPRTSELQSQLGEHVPLSQASAGDLLFFDTAGDGSVSHVGLYTGGMEMLGATTSKGVRYVDISTGYWMSRFLFAKSVLPQSVTVRPGDMLWKIGQEAGVTVPQLKAWNGLELDMIYPGQALFVENPDLTRKSASAPRRYHVVEPGETLWIVSQRYGVTLQRLIRWNELADPDRIAAGTVIYLEPPLFLYTVEAGDSLWKISQKTDVPIAVIMDWNGLTSDEIRIGQVLRLPQ